MALQKITEKIRGFPDWLGSSVSDFDEWVSTVSSRNKTVVYRGQRKYRPLIPSISRDNHPARILSIEKKLLKAFKKEAKVCLHLIPETDWEWLVVGQHHGLPTRVLDWSYNPYVALWFALKKHQQNDSAPEVWMLKPAPEDIIDSLENSRPFHGTRTKLFNTEFKIPRIREQEGCFILFKYIKKSQKGFVPLEKNKKIRRRIERIRLAKFAALEMLDEIAKKGFREAKLFPNIDEVAKTVKETIYNKMA